MIGHNRTINSRERFTFALQANHRSVFPFLNVVHILTPSQEKRARGEVGRATRTITSRSQIYKSAHRLALVPPGAPMSNPLSRAFQFTLAGIIVGASSWDVHRHMQANRVPVTKEQVLSPQPSNPKP
jgi:hypothetical protein